MMVLHKAYRAQLLYLCALFLTLLLPLATLVSCNQPAPPQFTSLNLGIPAAALQSPVKGRLPDTTELHVGITFKVNPQILNLIGQRPLRPGQSSNLEQFARRLGIDDATYQKVKDFFNAKGLVLQLSKLRTYLSVDAKAGTLARLMQTTFVMHQYKGRTFYAPATPPKIPTRADQTARLYEYYSGKADQQARLAAHYDQLLVRSGVKPLGKRYTVSATTITR